MITRTVLSFLVLFVCNLAAAMDNESAASPLSPQVELPPEKGSGSRAWAEAKANLDKVDMKNLQFDLEMQKKTAEILAPKGPWLLVFKLGIVSK
jgi:hypothetical protein